MTPLAALPAPGFKDAVLVYLAAAFVSFVGASWIFWRKRRQAGRHAAAAFGLAMFVAAMQLLVIGSLHGRRLQAYEHAYFRDLMLAMAIVLLPAFFISAFFMSASGALLAERNGLTAFPISRDLMRGAPNRWKNAGEAAILAIVSAAVALAYSLALFSAAKRVFGYEPRPAPGTEDVAVVFAGQTLLVLGFGLAAAFWEEIFVRFFLQNALLRAFRRAKGGAACAVIVASAIWAAGHAGTMEPEVVKFLQVFVIGLLFGLVCLRRGIETCLLAHSTFNVGILIVGGFQ